MNRKFLISAIPLIACLPLLVSGAYGQTTVKGKVAFKGAVPKVKPISMDADPVCAGKHTGPVVSESVVVKADGSMKNVFVYVSKGLEGKTFPAPADAVVLDQDGCMYKPHVFGIMVGQQLKVVNSDATTHNVHSLADVNEQFNVGQRAGQAPIVKTFTKPEATVPLVCNQHPWMRSVAHVMSNPYFAVSDENGAFDLKGLPPGKYTVTAIHEKFGAINQQVTVVAGKPVAPLTFTFSAGVANQPSPLKTMPAVMIP